MYDKLFDRIMRERLKDVGSGHQPSGWAYLQRRLDAEAASGPETSPSENAFDDVFRQKLQPETQAMLSPDWETLEERLDELDSGVPEPSHEAFDEALFQKLRHLHVPFRRQHWARMADRLDGEFVNAGSVWRSKLIELGLIGLLFFTYWQHFNPILPAAGIDQETRSLPSVKPAVSSDLPVGERAEHREAESALTQAGPAPQTMVVPAEAPPVVRDAAPAATGEAQDRLGAAAAADRLPPVDQGAGIESAPHESLRMLLLTPDRSKLLATGQPVFLAAAQPNTIRSTQPYRLARTGTVTPVKQRPFIHVGMFGSVDYNRIISPATRFLDTRLQKFDRYELGYSGGINLGFDLGRWEIQSGAIYSSKQYRPLQAEFWDGAFDEGYAKVQLKDIQLNIVQVPLLFRYNLIHYDSWRFYMLAGATVHVAVRANYFYDNIGTPDPGVVEPNRGWFDGGSFRENSYMTGNVGVGLERYMTPKWSLFAQPTYQHAINLLNHGMGPTRDRISTMSIYTGIRVRLER